jgi:dolichyl-phosphate-mannose-protein mannosyltransferase
VTDQSDQRTARPSWSRADTIAVAIVAALACCMRGYRLTRPPFIYSDELFYAREACNYVYRSPSTCGIPLDAVSAHPPMGKWLISLGIRALGWEPLGWRIASVIAGALTVGLLYLLARRLLQSTTAATFAAGLLAIDFLHLVQSRIAMLDVFLTMFVVAAFTFVVIDRDSVARARSGGARDTVWTAVRSRPWLVAAGIAAGGAIATKWVGVLGLLGSASVALLLMARVSGAWSGHALATAVRREWLALTIAFGMTPALVYTATYGPRVEGAVFRSPLARGSWVRGFAREQRDMLQFHRSSAEIRYLGTTNPFASPAWSWPLVRRPMIYYSEPRTGAGRETIMAIGNPLVWWTALACLGALVIGLTRRRGSDAAVVAVVGFAAVYGPLLIVSAARAATFIYYMLPAVPFMCLGIAAVVAALRTPQSQRRAMIAISVVAAVTFTFFYPVLTAQPLTERGLAARQVFRDCGAPSAITPPTGWCWR